jgi:serine/threonine protein kinase
MSCRKGGIIVEVRPFGGVSLQTNKSGKNSGNLERHPDNEGELPQAIPADDQSSAEDYRDQKHASPSQAQPEGASLLPVDQLGETASLPETDLQLSRGAGIGSNLPGANEVGTIIDRKYELLALLGSGGMCAVYKARHAFMRNIVAVKLMHPRLLVDSQSVKRFQHEARAASRLKHANSITVHEFGISGSQPYLVMDYLDGISLSDLIKQEGKIDVERCLHIFIQACDALADAHEHGIIHRDLKPSNIMLVKNKDDNCFVKVVDFGIAKIVSEGGESLKLTSTGEVFGSPLYMSPEQCMGQTLDVRADLYSMGCLMYESLTGKTPFAGKNVLETILKQTSEPPPSLGAIDGDVRVVQKLDAIVLKCLAKAPEQRYQSMKDLKIELESAAKSAFFGWKSWAKFGRKASQVERMLVRRMGQPRKITLVTIFGTALTAALAAVWFVLYGPGIGFALAERELPVEAVIDQTLKPPSKKVQDFGDKLWTRVDPHLPNSTRDFEKIDQAFKFYTELGDRSKASGMYALAALSYDRAFNLSTPLRLDFSLQAVDILNSRAECQLRAGGSLSLKLAKESGLIALDKLGAIGAETSPQALLAHASVAQACYRLGDLPEAKKNFELVRHLFFQGAFKNIDNLTLAATLFNVGRFELEQGDAQKASEILGPDEAFWSNLGGVALFNLASVQNDLGMAKELKGNHEEAQKLFESANRILASAGPTNNAYRAKVLLNLSDSYLHCGDLPAALRTRIGSLKLRAGLY